ncbi:hypothetical protein [Candidatus Chlamydia sanziniae]|nr:hypothetical protein [Candidatus Chlamydia sanziniae]
MTCAPLSFSSPLSAPLSLISSPLSLISSSTQTSFAYSLPKIGRRSTLRIILDILIVTLGIGILVSVAIVLFFLYGLNLLSIPVIVTSFSFVLIGFLCIVLGLYFMVNSVNQGLVGTLQKRLMENETVIEELSKELKELTASKSQEMLQLATR